MGPQTPIRQASVGAPDPLPPGFGWGPRPPTARTRMGPQTPIRHRSSAGRASLLQRCSTPDRRRVLVPSPPSQPRTCGPVSVGHWVAGGTPPHQRNRAADQTRQSRAMLLLALQAKALQRLRPCSALAASLMAIMPALRRRPPRPRLDEPRPRTILLALVPGPDTWPRQDVTVLGS